MKITHLLIFIGLVFGSIITVNAQYTGQSVYTLTVDNTATNIQWYKSNASGVMAAISGATTANYVASQSGVYYATYNLPTCTGQVSTASVLTSDISKVVLDAGTNNTGATYLWRLNNATIAGQTASTLNPTQYGSYSLNTNGLSCNQFKAFDVYQLATAITACGGVVGGMQPNDDYDADGVCNKDDLDDDNDGITDTDENKICSLPGINPYKVPSSAIASSTLGAGFNTGDISVTINNSGMSGTGVNLVHAGDIPSMSQNWFGDDTDLTPKLTYNYSTATDLNGFALWAPKICNTTDPDAPFRDFTYKVTYNGGLVYNSPVQSTVNPLTQVLPAPPQFYFFPSTLTGVTKIEIQVINVWATFNCTLSTGTNSTHNVTLGEFKGIDPTLTPGSLYACADFDNDGILNSFDLDSDGDGCPDALENDQTNRTGADLLTNPNVLGGNSGATFNGNYFSPVTLNFGTSAQSAEGAVGIPAISGFGASIGTSQDKNTVSSECTPPCTDATKVAANCDYDGDGVPNSIDLDDDNDGILDAVESPSCFLTATEAAVIVSAFSDIIGAEPASKTIDVDVTTTYGQLELSSNWVDKTIYGIQLTAPTPITGLVFKSNYWPLSADAASTFQLEGANFDGTGWTNLSSAPLVWDGNPPATFTATNNLHPTTAYKYYRLKGVAGTSNYGQILDISPVVNTAAYVPSANQKPNCTGSDTDGDGIANYLDLDADNDGCTDAIEGGASFTSANLVTSTMPGGNTGATSGTYNQPVTQNLGNTVGSTATTLGVPTIAGTGQTAGTSQNAGAFDAQGNCPCTDPTKMAANCDYDGDGIVNDIDLDDDNDGILDAIESPNCFYTEMEASTIVSVKTALANDDGVNVDLPFMHNGILTNVAASNNVIAINGAVNGAVIYTVEYTAPIKLTSLSHYGSTFGTSATARIEGSNDGLTWTSLMTAATAATATTKTFTVNQNANFYKYYRIVKVAGTSTPLITTYEVKGVVNATGGYVASANTKPTCTSSDTDGDGISNHLDLDSDNDGCTDAIEGGASFTTANLVASTMPGGNTGATSGTYNQPVTKNLGNTVDANGVPTIAGAAGQTVGTSENTSALDAEGNCLATCGGVVGGMQPNDDFDGDGVCNSIDLDDDNDGVLDYIETNVVISAFPKTGVTATSDWALNAGDLLDGSVTYQVNMGGNSGVGQKIIQFDLPSAQVIGAVEFSVYDQYQSGLQLPTVYTSQGWDGTQWVDLVINENAVLGTPIYNPGNSSYANGTTSLFLKLNNSSNAYSKYRVINVLGSGVDNGWFMEAYLIKNTITELDTDGDGIPNRFDLDSDGDLCSDAYESGTTTSTTSNFQYSNSNVGPNGFEDSIESGTVAKVGKYAGNYTYWAATSKLVKTCVDSDGDGLINANDLDDDNDGILDKVEGCENATQYVTNPSMELTNGNCPNMTTATTIPYATGWFGYILSEPNEGQLMVYDPSTCISNKPADSWSASTALTGGADGKNWLGFHTGEGTVNQLQGVVKAGQIIDFGFYAGWVLEAPFSEPSGPIDVWGYPVGGSISNKVLLGSVTVTNQISSTNQNWVYYTFTGSANVDIDRIAFVPNVNVTSTSYYYIDLFSMTSKCIPQDTDGDGIANQLDLDSDNDGCTDAIEGGASFTNANLVVSTMPGGNTGATSGTYNQPVTQNLGNTVDANGVPTIAGAAGQTVGTSANAAALDAQGNCPCTDPTKMAANCDYDGDGIVNDIDLDDDNDGILDTVECGSTVLGGIGYFHNNPVGTMDVDNEDLTFPNVATKLQYAPTEIIGSGFTATMVGSALNIATVGGPGTDLNYAISNNHYSQYTFTPLVPMTLIGMATRLAGFSDGQNSFSTMVSKDGGAFTLLNTVVSVINDGYSDATNLGLSAVSCNIQNITLPLEANSTYVFRRYYYNNIWSSGVNSSIDDTQFSFASACLDTDGDGLPNQFDLDSDNDGCTDAIEGGASFTTANLVASTMPGGNTGATSGTYNQPVTQNLGNTVGSTATTLGVPTIAGTGQTVGTSANAGTQDAACVLPCTDPTKMAANCDYDGDGKINSVDLDDDNDGILDTVECANTLQRINYSAMGYTDAGISAVGGQTIDLGVFSPIYAGITLNIKYETTNATATATSGLVNTTFPDVLLLDGIAGQTQTIRATLSAPIPGFKGIFDPTVYTNNVVTFSSPGALTSPVPGTYNGTVTVTTNTASNTGANYELPTLPWGLNYSASDNKTVVISDAYGSTSSVGNQKGFLLELPMPCDTDGDGIVNQFDLDSDNDGCTDAIEGGASFTTANLVTSTMPGGNTGTTSGTYNQPVTQNLGNTVDANGVPTIAGAAGQTVGTSANAGTQDAACVLPCNDPTKMAFNCDYDGDGINNFIDLDDDNDGILDTNECGISTQNIDWFSSGFSNAGISAVGGQTKDLGVITGYPEFNGINITIEFLTNDVSNASGLIASSATPWMTISNNSLGTTQTFKATLSQPIPGFSLTYDPLFVDGESIVFTSPGVLSAPLPADAINGDVITSTSILNPVGGSTIENNYGAVRFTSLDNQTIYFNTSVATGGTLTSSQNGVLLTVTRLIRCDTDGDGIANYFDLDSDNDGCTDAIEGGASFTSANLVTSTMPGGNTGATSGTYNQPVTQNLGNTVGNTATTLGVPTIAGTGQTVGTSANTAALDAQGNCAISCLAGTTAPAITAPTLSNTCPNTTVSLASLANTGTKPAGTTLIWSTHNTPSVSGDTLTSLSVTAGKYYAFYYDKVNNCYSPADSVVVTINTCNSGPCPLGTTIGASQYALTSSGGYPANATDGKNAAGAPNGYFTSAYNTGTFYAVKLSYLNNFYPGDEVTLTAAYNDGRNDGIYLEFSIDGVNWQTSPLFNPPFTTTLTNYTYKIPTSFSGPFAYIQLRGNSANSYVQVDAVKVTSTSCNMATVNTYLDNGAGGGTSNDCSQNGTEPSLGTASGLFINIIKAGAVVNSFPVGNPTTLSNLADGAYTMIISENPFDVTPKLYTYTTPSASKSISVVNGVITPAPLEFCMQILDSDGDGISDLIDLDDDNDGILDTAEMASATPPTCAATITGQPDFWYDIDHVSPCMTCLETDVDGNPWLTTNFSQYSRSWIPGNGWTIAGGNINGGWTFSTYPTTIANAIANNNYFEFSYTPKNYMTMYDFKSFSLNADVRIDYSTSSNFTSPTTLYTGHPVAPYNFTNFPLTTPLVMKPGVQYFIRVYFANITPEGPRADVDSWGWHWRCPTAGEYPTSLTTVDKDTDGDSIADRLDLDADNDGCTDAIEGGASFTSANLVTSTMPGGNTGSTSGSYNQPVTQNLGNTVGNTATTMGVPTIAGTGQTVGTSANAAALDAQGNCPCTDPTKMAANCDYDGDGKINSDDLDDDNDGILDSNECVSLLTAGLGQNPNMWWDINGNGVLAPGGANNLLPGQLQTNGIPTYLNTASTVSYGTDVASHPINVKFGTGITVSAVDTRWRISGATATDLASAKSNNDYLEFGFTTAAFGTGKLEINAISTFMFTTVSPFGVIDYYDNVGVEISTSPTFATSNALYNGPVIPQPLNNTGLDFPNGGFIDYPASSNVLLPNTTYYARVYFYGETDGVGDFDAIGFDYKFSCDTDGDGIANNLDLDSDNDGCTDAIEGGASFTSANLVASTMPGGNTGATSGTYNQPVTQNLGNTVDANGVPTIAGAAGQTVGTSANAAALDAQGNCGCSDPTKMAADCDYDGDGKINSIDLDDDNDGILDTNECNAIERVAHGNDFTGSGTHVSTVSPWTLNTGTVFTNPNVVGFVDDNLVQTFSQNVSHINLIGTGTILNFNLSIADGTPPATSLASRYSVFYGGVEYCRIETATGISTNATITYMNGAAGTPSVLPMISTNSVSITLPNNVPNNGVLMFKFDPTIAGTATASLGADDFYLHSVSIQTCTDTDGDGILNQFDLDTDNDGCTDAIEGGASFTTANLVTSTMPGGNIGAISGTYNQPVTQNLGNTVDANGVPTIAGAAGQTAGTSANAAALDAQGNCLTCNAGTTAPAITATTLSNTCPSTTVSLASLANTGTKPAGTTLIWSTHNTPSVSGDTLTSLSVTAGKYYAFYYDKVNNCYSPADSIVVTITPCTSPVTVGTPPLVTGPVGTTVTGNPPVNVAGGTAPYTYSDGANDPLCTAPTAPTLVLPAGLITGLNASTGAHSVNTTGLVVGTIYQYCIKVCDTSGTNCAMSKHTILVTATCNAGTVAPILIKN